MWQGGGYGVMFSLYSSMVLKVLIANLKLSKDSTPTCENWRLFAPCVKEKASHLAAKEQVYMHT